MNRATARIGESTMDKPTKCQCCGEEAELTCGPSRFGEETWACSECWNPSEDHEWDREEELDSIGWFG